MGDTEAIWADYCRISNGEFFGKILENFRAPSMFNFAENLKFMATRYDEKINTKIFQCKTLEIVYKEQSMP